MAFTHVIDFQACLPGSGICPKSLFVKSDVRINLMHLPFPDFFSDTYIEKIFQSNQNST